MIFWNRFVRCVYRSFATDCPPGREDVPDVFDLANELLPFSRLDDLSLALIVLHCDAGEAVRQQAEAALCSRDGWQWGMADGLVRNAQRRWTDLLTIFAAADAKQRNFVFEAFRITVGFNLTCFLRVMWLEDSNQAAALRYVWDALSGFDLKHAGIIDLECFLYRSVLNMQQATPQSWPSPEPDWAAPDRLEQVERAFIDCALKLNPKVRWLVYLSFYAGLTAEQIVCVLQTRDPNWQQPELVKELRTAWKMVLACMKDGFSGAS